MDENEGLEVAARRELEEETGVTGSSLVQTGAYGENKSRLLQKLALHRYTDGCLHMNAAPSPIKLPRFIVIVV